MDRNEAAHEHVRPGRLAWLGALAALAALALVQVLPAPSATNCTPGSWGASRPDLASQVVSLVNAHRASIGRAPLAVSSTLQASSVWKSLHMAGHGYFAHDDPAPPVSRSAFQRARDCDYGGSSWGENIASGYPTAQAVMNGWLSSAGHKANIENAGFTAIGVGVASSGGGTLYWTQNFGVGGSPPPPPPPPPPAPPAAPQPPPAAAPPPASAPSATPPPGAASAPPATQAPKPPKAPAPAAKKKASRLPVGAMPARVSKAKAGARLQARVLFVHLTSRKRVEKGSVRCRALLGQKRLRVVTNAFIGGRATCAWKVPSGAKGRDLTGIVAVQIGDKAATRVFFRRVA